MIIEHLLCTRHYAPVQDSRGDQVSYSSCLHGVYNLNRETAVGERRTKKIIKNRETGQNTTQCVQIGKTGNIVKGYLIQTRTGISRESFLEEVISKLRLER